MQTKQKKVNYGCGADYREGWINVDIVEETKWRGVGRPPDLLVVADECVLPLEDNSIDYILADSVIEHVERQRVHGLLMEFHRVLKPGGELEIWAPHFKGIMVKFVEHVRGYGINSFWFYERFFIIHQKLLLASRSHCSGKRWMRGFNILNPLFNLSNTWQQICEKFVPGGFEEIHYVMAKKP